MIEAEEKMMKKIIRKRHKKEDVIQMIRFSEHIKAEVLNKMEQRREECENPLDD